MTAVDRNALRLELLNQTGARLRSLMERHNAQWVLALTLGNAGSLLAIAGKLLTTQSEAITALLMPSCWMFVFGLFMAASINPLAGFRAARGAATLEQDYLDTLDGAEREDERTDWPIQVRVIFIVEYVIEGLSATALAGGLIYPLAVLCYRYQHSGHGFF